MNLPCNDAPIFWKCRAIKCIDGCNSYERYLTCENPPTLDTYVLVSYCTPVCTISIYSGTPTYIYANGASTCSASTKRHVKRFLLRHGFDENTQNTILNMCNGLPYDNFMRFDVDTKKHITGGTWLKCNLTPPTVSVGNNGRLNTYTPRFGFYGRNDYYIEGGKAAGFQCYTRI